VFTGPRTVRVDLTRNSDFVKKFGKKVKSLGGHYSECRGHGSARYVTLPIAKISDERLAEVTALIGQLVKEFGPSSLTTFVFETSGGAGIPAWVEVQRDTSFEHALASYWTAMENAIERKLMRRVTESEIVADEKRALEEYRQRLIKQALGMLDTLSTEATALGFGSDEKNMIETLSDRLTALSQA
jgi:hypothetical protein